MANVQFSAPEQFEKDAVLTPATDIFALGQTLYWCVTKKTFRGTNHTAMSSIDASYRPFDEVVASMSGQLVKARPQTAKEAFDELTGQDKANELKKSDEHILDSLKGFEAALRRFTPGARGIVHLNKKSEIDQLLLVLAGICKSHDLWWTQGHGYDSVERVIQLDEQRWMIDITELRITDCWISRDSGVDHCFILLRSDAMPTFGIYGSHGWDNEVVGLVDGVFITASEHDDGFARIADEIVDVSARSTLRRRYLRPHFFFIATKYSPILDQSADETLHTMIQAYQSGAEVIPSDLSKLRKLAIHSVSRKYN